jgi:uncharacterized protein (DUF2336 family)
MPQDESGRRRADAAPFQAIVDQFMARPLHPAEDVALFETLACGFIEVLDVEAVAERAEQLCRHPDTPPSVVTRLVDKGGRAARLALELAPKLHADLARVTALHGPAEMAAAIARRSVLDRQIVACLVSRGESEVLCALAANRRLHLDQAARRALLQAGRDDPRLARILLDRADLALDSEPLFLAAGAEERARILVEACARALAIGGPDTVLRAPPAVMEEIEACAIGRDSQGLADALAEGLDCRKSRARAVVADPGGEAMALALLVLGVAEDTAIRIFIGAEWDAPNVERVRGLVALMRSTPPRAAQRIVSAMTGVMRQEKDRTAAPAPSRPQGNESGRRRRGAARDVAAKARV